MSNLYDFAMDYEAMVDLATQVSAIQTDFEEMLKSLDSLVQSVDGQWQGKAQVEFAVAYSKLQPKLMVISDVLKNYVTEINKAAANEQELECVNAAIAQAAQDRFRIVPISATISEPTF